MRFIISLLIFLMKLVFVLKLGTIVAVAAFLIAIPNLGSADTGLNVPKVVVIAVRSAATKPEPTSKRRIGAVILVTIKAPKVIKSFGTNLLTCDGVLFITPFKIRLVSI